MRFITSDPSTFSLDNLTFKDIIKVMNDEDGECQQEKVRKHFPKEKSHMFVIKVFKYPATKNNVFCFF